MKELACSQESGFCGTRSVMVVLVSSSKTEREVSGKGEGETSHPTGGHRLHRQGAHGALL